MTMSGPSTEVSEAFDRAYRYAELSQSNMSSFTAALNSSIYSPPTISMTWNSIAAPSLPSMPVAPSMPTISFAVPGGQPTELSIDMPGITIDDFTETAPTLTLPTAPTLSYGAVPTVPSAADVAVPAAPVVTMPAEPTYLSLSTVSFAGVDLHEDWLARLEDMPTLTLVSPTPFSYARGSEYASTLLNALKATLEARLSGGTGIPEAVEQAIWDRARSRETKIALANEAEIQRASEALGFQLPSGVIAAQLREAQQNYYDKLSELSRDVAIKQAELEQANLKDTIAAGMQLEGQLIDYAFKLEQLSFETARAYADNAIQSHNAAVEQFKALLVGYQTYAQSYDTLIKAELAKVEVYKAQLQGEQTKAQINESLVQQFKAQIDAGMSQVEIYRAQVGAAQTLVQLEQTKISAAGEQVRAYVAQVNAETAKVEAYKASVQAQSTLVDMYKTKADAFSAKVGAQAEKAKAELARYNALVSAKTAEWDGYKAKVQTEGERIKALGIQSGALLDGYKAEAAAIESEAKMITMRWETQIKDYEASQQLMLQTAKINADVALQTNNARLDAAKVGAQVYAQLTSSAYGMVNASASISGSASNSVSYSYGGDVAGEVTPKTAV
ncbi:hypothetical protein AC731_006410 [Thauera humireducens]|uniref:Uncharacterized protein n=2 Tax=Thauera humireducens TaxID=1134435 RepID=A0A127K4R1_9RHOO|nr:hypothetical protein AC731_006410 [Thauera humireducens]